MLGPGAPYLIGQMIEGVDTDMQAPWVTYGPKRLGREAVQDHLPSFRQMTSARGVWRFPARSPVGPSSVWILTKVEDRHPASQIMGSTLVLIIANVLV
jgi:hypothetical protein